LSFVNEVGVFVSGNPVPFQAGPPGRYFAQIAEVREGGRNATSIRVRWVCEAGEWWDLYMMEGSGLPRSHIFLAALGLMQIGRTYDLVSIDSNDLIGKRAWIWVRQAQTSRGEVYTVHVVKPTDLELIVQAAVEKGGKLG
jgi:hypothetical protein